jgi:hypothetical protein
MTEPDNFISRWARLKRESDTPHETGVSGNSLPPGPAETGLAGTEATADQPGGDAAEEPFDLASLPSIDAINVNTDIRGFLQSRVPAELTRAALRRAWASDPAIRDFIGIAENQWDFNDPDAIPGFGPLPVADTAPAVVAQVSTALEKIPEGFSEMPISGVRAPATVTVAGHSATDRSVPQMVGDPRSADPGIAGSPNQDSEVGGATKADHGVEASDASRNRRRHGSAMPR